MLGLGVGLAGSAEWVSECGSQRPRSPHSQSRHFQAIPDTASTPSRVTSAANAEQRKLRGPWWGTTAAAPNCTCAAPSGTHMGTVERVKPLHLMSDGTPDILKLTNSWPSGPRLCSVPREDRSTPKGLGWVWRVTAIPRSTCMTEVEATLGTRVWCTQNSPPGLYLHIIQSNNN